MQLINYEILFRDTFLYAASVDSRGLDATVEILGEVVLRPQITDDELKMVFYLRFNNFYVYFFCLISKQDSKELNPRPLANAPNSYLDEGSKYF